MSKSCVEIMLIDEQRARGEEEEEVEGERGGGKRGQGDHNN